MLRSIALAFVLFMLASRLYADPYVSLGAGAVQSMNTTDHDNIEFNHDPWLSMTAAIGNDTVLRAGRIDFGVEFEAAIIPGMPQHGANQGNNHQNTSGQRVTIFSTLVSVLTTVRLTEDWKAYLTGGDGFGYGNSGVGTGMASQAGIGLRYAVSERTTADLSFRYRNMAGLGFVGPEARLLWSLP